MPATGNPRLGAQVNRPYILAQSAVPVCLAPNGTVATNGTITLGTALPATYSGGIWLRLPAGAVSGGAAGLYWAVMSSTTQGQVYTTFVDPASPFTPYIPSGTLTNATGSNSAYTQTTASDITLVNVTVPGGAMGPNGGYNALVRYGFSNTANNKTIRTRFGGSNIGISNVSTSSAGIGYTYTLQNCGVNNIQVGPNSTGEGNNPAYLAIDTSVDVALTFTGNLATATDFILIAQHRVEILPS